MIMRRFALAVSLVAASAAALLGLAGPASGAPGDPIPMGDFLSPPKAAAGSPMWISSVTPCPATPALHIQYVAVWITNQEEPGHADTLKIVYGDLNDDGSWRVTISAPSSVPAGATASYFIGARCIVSDPYPSPNATNAVVDYPSQGYFFRSLRLTSTGTGSFTGTEPSQVVGSPTTTTTTSTTTTTTTSTTTSTTSTTIAGLGGSSLGGSSLGTASAGGPSHEPALDGDDDDVSLNALTASGSRSGDGSGRSDVGGLVVFVALIAGLGLGGWQLSRFGGRR
jgi:hypothetical protein